MPNPKTKSQLTECLNSLASLCKYPLANGTYTNSTNIITSEISTGIGFIAKATVDKVDVAELTLIDGTLAVGMETEFSPYAVIYFKHSDRIKILSDFSAFLGVLDFLGSYATTASLCPISNKIHTMHT